MKSLWAKCKENIFAIIGFICTSVIPLLLFGMLGSFTKTGFWAKFTIWFYIALVIFAIIVATKLKSKVKSMPHSIKRGVLLSIFTLVFWLILFDAFWFVGSFADKLINYWIVVGVCFLTGRFFYILDENKKSEK